MNVIRIDQDPIRNRLARLYRRREVLDELIRHLESLNAQPKPGSVALRVSSAPSVSGSLTLDLNSKK